MKVLITDAAYQQSLGAIRSLGKKGIYVIGGSHSALAQSFYSKYCREKVIYPTPQMEDEFVRFMLRYVQKNKIDVLLPIGYLTTTALSKYYVEFCKYTKLLITSGNSMEIASNKDKTMQLAMQLGIKTPKMYKSIEEVKGFPIVVKSVEDGGQVRYVNSPEELYKINTSGSIIQEYIPGEGYGFFALFNRGNVRATFMHKRIREFPVTGGKSTAAESIYDPKLKDLGLRLLKSLNWHGVAMVEFKKDSRDGEFKLMELNPKFWGSLDLSIASGIDFPYLAVKMAVEGDIKAFNQYKVGVKFRWPAYDFLNLITNPSLANAFISDFFNKNSKSNIWLSDIKPNIFEFIIIFLSIISSRIKKRNLKYPHGIPKIKS